jgi:hypothetical protein
MQGTVPSAPSVQSLLVLVGPARRRARHHLERQRPNAPLRPCPPPTPQRIGGWSIPCSAGGISKLLQEPQAGAHNNYSRIPIVRSCLRMDRNPNPPNARLRGGGSGGPVQARSRRDRIAAAAAWPLGIDIVPDVSGRRPCRSSHFPGSQLRSVTDLGIPRATEAKSMPDSSPGIQAQVGPDCAGAGWRSRSRPGL